MVTEVGAADKNIKIWYTTDEGAENKTAPAVFILFGI